jgi:hypothetical protein
MLGARKQLLHAPNVETGESRTQPFCSLRELF